MQNYRIQSIDLIKIIAMICVMGLHCAGAFVSHDYDNLWGNIVGRISVCAIPLFFMVSGYLLLGRPQSDFRYSLKKSKSIIRFVAICTVGFTLIYWIVCLLRHVPIHGLDLVKNFFGAFIQKGAFGIFWYFGAMIIIYWIYPILNRVYLNRFQKYVGLLLTLFFVEFIVFALHISHNSLNISYLSPVGGGPAEAALIQPFRIWNWLFYFMLGGIFKKEVVVNWLKSYCSIWMVAVLGAINVALQMLLRPALGNIACEYFYCSFFVIGYSASLFILICSTQIANNKIIDEMSQLFLPVYAFHPFVINILYKFNVIWDSIGSLAPVAFWISVSIVTITISYFFMKIPLAKNLFTI